MSHLDRLQNVARLLTVHRDNLNRHNVLEHDASLRYVQAQYPIAYETPTNTPTTSRSDAFFGNNHVFNQSVFDTSTVYWTTDILTPVQIANSKLARQVTSRAYNPEYTFSTTTEEFSLGEVAAPFIVFGTLQDPTVEKNLVTYFFGMLACPIRVAAECHY